MIKKLYKEFILKVVQQYGHRLRYASDELKNDKEVVLEAIQDNGWALGYASDELQNDHELRKLAGWK